MSSLAPLPEASGDPRSSVIKAMTLLGHFESGATLGISELARQSGLPKSTVFRLLGTLEEARILVRCPGGYRVGDRLINLGRAALDDRSDSLIKRARPHLARLFCSIPGSVELSVLRSSGLRVLDVITHPRVEGLTLTPGDLISGQQSSASHVLQDHRSPVRPTEGAASSQAARPGRLVAGAWVCPSDPVLGGRTAISAVVTQNDLREAVITAVLPRLSASHELDRVAGHVAQCANQLSRSLCTRRARSLQTVGN